MGNNLIHDGAETIEQHIARYSFTTQIVEPIEQIDPEHIAELSRWMEDEINNAFCPPDWRPAPEPPSCNCGRWSVTHRPDCPHSFIGN